MNTRAARGLVIAGLALTLGHGGVLAQTLGGRLTDQCVRATVKITAVYPGGTSFGSGSVIDGRGYVLTNFHVIGHRGPSRGTPGSLLLPNNRYRVATVDNSREAARPRWIAKVVRADVRLDLALMRIMSDEDGTAIRGAPFTAVKMGRTSDLRPGSQVWAFGYPLGVRTINVTGGDVTGFQMNARNQVAWLRSDAEFNPGNSGGMLVDDRGRIVAVPTSVVREGTLEPVELARPTERIPAEWLTALRRGHVDDLKIEGIPTLQPRLPYYDTSIGDDRALGNREELIYLLPETRPAIVRVSKSLDIVVADARGRILRRGRGEVEVDVGDPPDMMAAVVVRGDDEATAFDIRVEPVRPPPAAVASAEEDGAAHDGDAAAGDDDAPLAPPRPPVSPAPPSPVPEAPVATVIGRARDAATGRPVVAFAAVGRPGVDVRRQLEAFQAGRIDADELDNSMLVNVRADVEGRFELPGIPRGRTHSLAVAFPGYRPVVTDFRVPADASLVNLPPVDLVAYR
jgi:serine protease Do